MGSFMAIHFFQFGGISSKSSETEVIGFILVGAFSPKFSVPLVGAKVYVRSKEVEAV